MHVCFRHFNETSFLSMLLPPESQDSKDGMSMSAGGTEDRKPPPVPEECGKSKVASWLTSQSSSTESPNVKIEGGMKTEKKVRGHLYPLPFLHLSQILTCFHRLAGSDDPLRQ